MTKFKDAVSELHSAKAEYNHNCMVWPFLKQESVWKQIQSSAKNK